MKRLPQPQNHNVDPNSRVQANPKRSRGIENKKNSVSDSDVKKVQMSMPTSNGCQVDGETGVAQSSSNFINGENSISYYLRSKNPKSVRNQASITNNDNNPKRVQQPDVFVNTNLMKVKMEVDYVPIKTEPDQEIEDDNNDNGSRQMSSPTFSFESRDSNTNSLQNADEDNHELGGLGSEREQQQQQETVATLHERVNFLSQEKVEMQRILQNEIFQLKLANAQQQTSINSLNSLITLQRDENTQLKSEVAKQQNQIEELNQKIKSVAENQPLEISNWPTKVLSRIFNYLDLKSVKESRLVCRRWRSGAGKILLKNFYLVCDDKTRCENAFINWHRKSYPMSTTKAGKLWSKDKNSQGTLQLLRKFKGLRSSITELVFTPQQPLTENLYEILQLLPNLQVLDTKVLDLSPLQKWLENDKILYNGNPIKLQLLVQKLETMDKLKLDFFMTNAISTHFLHHHQQFASIKSLETRLIGMNFMMRFMNYSFCNWTITRLTLAIQENYDVQLIRRFFSQISPSLQHLKLMLQTPHDNFLLPLSVSSFKPWTDDWIIPLGLNRVETLEIEKAYQKEELVVKCVVAALQLPRLKKLTVVDILFGMQLEHIIQNWNSHESANGRKLASESLEELEISSWFASTLSSKKIPNNPWPRLKSLKCACKFSESFDASFLSELRNLERLELRVSWDWTLGESMRMKNEADDKRSSSQFQLRDLKNLKSFYLKFWGNEKRYQDFTNSLVAKDLKFMKNLQYVQFNGVVIDPEPLKSALGPNVPIIFIN